MTLFILANSFVDFINYWGPTLENIGKIIFAIAGLFSLIKWVIIPIKKFIRKIFLEDREKLDFIYKELKPNGGGSIKDHINLIRDSVLRTEIWQKTRLSHENLPYFDTNAHGKIIWVNKAFMRILNASESDILGYGIRNFIDNRDKNRVIKEWDESLDKSMDLRTSFRIKDSNGKIRCMECNALAVRGGKDGEIIGYTGVLVEKDITDCEN